MCLRLDCSSLKLFLNRKCLKDWKKCQNIVETKIYYFAGMEKTSEIFDFHEFLYSSIFEIDSFKINNIYK